MHASPSPRSASPLFPNRPWARSAPSAPLLSRLAFAVLSFGLVACASDIGPSQSNNSNQADNGSFEQFCADNPQDETCVHCQQNPQDCQDGTGGGTPTPDCSNFR